MDDVGADYAHMPSEAVGHRQHAQAARRRQHGDVGASGPEVGDERVLRWQEAHDLVVQPERRTNARGVDQQPPGAAEPQALDDLQHLHRHRRLAFNKRS